MFMIVVLLRAILVAVLRIERNTTQIKEALKAMKMSISEVLRAIDNETNRIASRFEELLKKANEDGLSDADQALADAEIAKLKGIGADAENPVPAAPPAAAPADSGSTPPATPPADPGAGQSGT